jgi:hypothetical protein
MPQAIPVTVTNFVRAETDLYFASAVKDGGFGKLAHRREMAAIDDQDVVRMNRDTLYSSGVFDLDAGKVTLTLPNTGKRFMSAQAISEDHYAFDVSYAPERRTYTAQQAGTRYMVLVIRTLADPTKTGDLEEVHRLQDAIRIDQANRGAFEAPEWDHVSLDRVRDELKRLGTMLGEPHGVMFGARREVDPVAHLIGTAAGWGGNPPEAASYESYSPAANDGKTVHRLHVKDVPVDGFWSISVYNADGYFEKNDRDAYSVNNLTAEKSADGSVTVQFGGCADGVNNCIPIMPGWNYTVRLYRPRPEILSGAWNFPEAQPVN